MKRIVVKALCIALLIGLVLSLTGCSDSDEIRNVECTEENVVGYWDDENSTEGYQSPLGYVEPYEDMSVGMRFYSNGTTNVDFSDIEGDNDPNDENNRKWEIKEGMLYIYYNHNDEYQIYEMVEIKGNNEWRKFLVEVNNEHAKGTNGYNIDYIKENCMEKTDKDVNYDDRIEAIKRDIMYYYSK